jgi:hypothetical protein
MEKIYNKMLEDVLLFPGFGCLLVYYVFCYLVCRPRARLVHLRPLLSIELDPKSFRVFEKRIVKG